MPRDRKRPRFRPEVLAERLEGRALLSGAGVPARAVHFHATSNRGVDYRLTSSRDPAQRVNQAFQVFAQNWIGRPATYQGAPSNLTAPERPGQGGFSQLPQGAIPVGTPPAARDLPSLLATLAQQTTDALTRFEIRFGSPQPSIRDQPRFAHAAPLALVPFAREQVAQLGSRLAALAPPGGPPPYDASLEAIDATYNRVQNALAEFSLHPELFRRPGDFYVNPAAQFTLDRPISDVPARLFPGFFYRGPGGAVIQGAHPR